MEEMKMSEQKVSTLTYHELNAMLNLYGPDGKIQFEKDKEAAKQYFLQNINQNMVWFHTLEEKLDYLVENDYYEPELLAQYSADFVKNAFKRAYDHKFRFEAFLGAYKFYTSYALKTFDGKRYLERFEDRVVMTALLLAEGKEKKVNALIDEMISGRFQPATPTFLNAGKKQRGELVSCFLLRSEDTLESISRTINASLQLSKRGGGVAINLTNIRELGAPIKKIENQSSGIIPVMKLLEDSFSYANQLGARQGAGAAYLNAHHPDIMRFLDTKRENADEKIRIKTLSIGIVVPDVTLELAKSGEDMYLFSPYDVERVYGVPMSDISITEKYQEMVDNPEIKKQKIKARTLFERIAELQFESGYPYIVYEDTVNASNPISGRINMSNLCVTGETKILTDSGYQTVRDLFNSQASFDVVVDKRARDMDMKNPGVSAEKSTKMFKTAEDAEVYKLTTSEGFELRATAWHKMYVMRDGNLIKIPLSEVALGDKILVQSGQGAFGKVHEPELAYLVGGLTADGTYANNSEHSISAKFYLYGDKKELAPAYEAAAASVLTGKTALLERQATLTPKFAEASNDKIVLSSAPIAKLLASKGFSAEVKHSVPEFILNGDKETQVEYLNGLLQLDGTLTQSKSSKSNNIEIGSISHDLLVDVQRMLLNLGVYSRIYVSNTAKMDMMPDGKGGQKLYARKDSWSLRVTSRLDFDRLADMITWRTPHQAKLEEVRGARSSKAPYRSHQHLATVESIEFDGVEDVYDVTVENGNSVIFNGLATGNCSEILQVNTPSSYNEDLSYSHVGRDISCNLGSLNIAKAMESTDFGKTIETAIRALTAVSDISDIQAVPSIADGNRKSHAIGLGQMNLHGYLAKEHIHYGSEEALDFTNMYFYTVVYHALRTSNKIAKERGETFYNFENSKYASGEFFDKYTEQEWKPETKRAAKLFEKAGITIPTQEDWKSLKKSVMRHGIYNQNLQAVPPTGSISYINNSTSSIHPVASGIEIRKEGKLGRVYYPAPYMDNDNLEYYQDAYEIGPEKIIDTYAVATQHVDQGLSLTLFFKDTATTRDVNRAQIYAWRKGIKTIYYIRIRQAALEGTEMEGCVSCVL